jgi:dipeptidyl aminopeptidase/acylaminoacyl peptidase
MNCHPERSDGSASRRETPIARFGAVAKSRKLMRRTSMRGIFLPSLLTCVIFASIPAPAQAAKPKLTLDEFFDSVSFDSVKLSPDGNSVIIETERPDWNQQIFRKELWLYRTASGSLVQLMQSGHDTSPQWSPDGEWIAFLSERKATVAEDEDAGDGDDRNKDKTTAQLFLISPSGGESVALTSSEEEVHAFAWSGDSKAIFFSTRKPLNSQQKDDHKKDWKDVIRFRGDERGDAIFRLNLEEALARHAALGSNSNSNSNSNSSSKDSANAEKDSHAIAGATTIAHSRLRITQISISHDGQRLAFVTYPPSELEEKVDDIELYLVTLASHSLANNAPEVTPLRLTRNEAEELNLEWAPDNRHLFFQVDLGSLERKYEDPQPRLYWIDADDASDKTPENRQVQRWFAGYPGEVVRYTVLSDGSVLCACRLGTEVQLISQANPKAGIVQHEGWAGRYELPAAAPQSQSMRIAFVYSAIARPAEVYIADGPNKLAQARPITSFNKLFAERELPLAKPYRWTSSDGTPVEGMLMYPPGKFEAKNLPMFVYIHGGPQDADGNHFQADWYQWDRLAATAGWLVFEPNYRGSTGYGDKFALGLIPEMVSAPGKDILTGVDALVRDGIADPNHLTVGGYSFGGYLTNWLITQTTRFKAAVTGAGAVEYVASWGNDDDAFDDAYFLGGAPWETPDRYRSEAPIFQINKVRTPTLVVAGAEDSRVPTLEAYLLDRALHALNVPSELLIFPGEGHSLDKNPWHGKIMVREELKWLEKYSGVTGTK